METKKNKMKQTAVEWFQDQIIKIVNGTCELSEIQIFEQAKAMEKEQMKNACIQHQYENKAFQKLLEKQFEQYYNETFKSE